VLLDMNRKEFNSKHIRVIYFLIKDRFKSGDITLKYCTATEMLGDHYFTKSLQGGMFQNFRADMHGNPIDCPYSYMGWYQDEEKAENMLAVSINSSPQEYICKAQKMYT
jgi:hypothetical protein